MFYCPDVVPGAEAGSFVRSVTNGWQLLGARLEMARAVIARLKKSTEIHRHPLPLPLRVYLTAVIYLGVHTDLPRRPQALPNLQTASCQMAYFV